MDFKEFKKKIDDKCDVMDSNLFRYNKDLHGKDVRDRILILTSWMPRYSYLSDKAKLESSTQKRKVEELESIVMRILCGEAGSSIPATLKKAHIDTYKFEFDGEMITVSKEKVKLEYMLYAVNRFESMVSNIKLAIFSYQSALNFDRDEIKQLSYSN